jgi:hypothetical protein
VARLILTSAFSNFFKNTSNEQIDKMIDDIENERIAYSRWKRDDIGDGKKK